MGIDTSRPDRSSDRVVLFAQTTKNDEPRNKILKSLPDCAHCKRRNHSLLEYHKFAKERVNQKWKIAKNVSLCYRCLEPISPDHSRSQCKSPMCILCGRNYHALLHFSNDYKTNMPCSIQANPPRSEDSRNDFTRRNPTSI